MKNACLFVHRVYRNNEIFNAESYLNRDNCLEFFHELKSQFAAKGINLQTQDKCDPSDAEFILFNEMPQVKAHLKYPEKSAVLLYESELIRPDNWDLALHKKFKFIFTWNDLFVDEKKYIKFNFTHYGKVPFLKFSEKSGFCTLIAGNKHVKHPLELYSKRIEAIRWFEKHHPADFEFYGIEWDLYTFKTRPFSRVLNKLKWLRRPFAGHWPLYRGPVKNKLEVLRHYKFCICFENGRDISGYITEKILDAFAAGCIPVYWGAPNIEKFIPSDCYIDFRKFSCYEDLYQYLKTMSSEDYDKRLESIEAYLKSPQHHLFEAAFNANIVVQRLSSW
jgi:alpha(1,3/1,4) fucosyltransferase